MPAINPVVLRRNMRIGEPDAESDNEYVMDCFVDNGVVGQVLNLSDYGSVLLGRTGSGKSAIIRRIQDSCRNVVTLSPEDLALSFISNSTVIKSFEEAGLNLDPFYNLLWKHILTVELVKKRFSITNDATQRTFLTWLDGVFRKDKAKDKAMAYLKERGEQFWIDSEYRVKEFTKKLEDSLEAEISAGHLAIKAKMKAGEKLSDEVKGEVVHLGQRAVNKIQIKDLHEVIRLLSEDIFTDPLEPYYICIDRLDDDWVGDDIRFKLLKSLIETIKAFRQVQNVKIIVALRTDLHASLMRRITSPGFQEEKYASYFVNVVWNREQLRKLLDARIRHLFKFRYTREDVGINDIFSGEDVESNRKAVDYIIDRTFFRPREAISFVNRCIERATGKSKITANIIRDCESKYSTDRLDALCSEWRREYPQLRLFCDLVRGSGPDINIGDIATDKIEQLATKIYESTSIENTQLRALAENAGMDGAKEGFPFCAYIASILYQVGVVGVKLAPNMTRFFSFENQALIDEGQLTGDTKLTTHKTFHVALGIRYIERK